MIVEGKQDWCDPFVCPSPVTSRPRSSLNCSNSNDLSTNRSDLDILKFTSNIPPAETTERTSDSHASTTTITGDNKNVTSSIGKLRFWKMVGLFVFSIGVSLVVRQVYIDKTDDCFLSNEDSLLRWKRLEAAVKFEIFGQELAVDGALNAILAHLTDPEPPKALVLAFHGWLGSGKTLLSHIIAKGLYDGGFRSPYVKVFIGPRHFLLDPILLSRNQAKLTELIEKSMKLCRRSLFIFDEADKMPHEILDALSPFVGHQGPVDGIEHRYGIFIFLSNTGGNKINNITLQALRSGRQREDLKIQEFTDVFVEESVEEPTALESKNRNEVSSFLQGKFDFLYSVWNKLYKSFMSPSHCNIMEKPFLTSAIKLPATGGLIGSEIIRKRLVDHFLPFLPLQRKQVLFCIKREMHRRNIIHVDPIEIANGLNYFPPGEEIFARDGCKNIPSHVAHYINHSQNIFTK